MHWKAFLRLTLSLSIIFLLLSACQGSNSGSEPPDQPVLNDSSILKVGSLRTAADPGITTTVFNDYGDGVAVWTVTSEGTWLYYSLYDSASDSWSRADRLAYLTNESRYVTPQVVTNGTGYAVAWRAGYDLYVSLLNGREWTTTRAEDDATSFQLDTNGSGYLLAWTASMDSYSKYPTYRANVYTTLSQDGTVWDDPVVHNEAEDEFASNIRIESNGSGYALTWLEKSNRIFANIFDGSAWQGTEELVNLSDSDINHLDIASNGSGYSLVWSASDNSVMNRIYTAADGWSQNSDVFGDNGDISYAFLDGVVSNGTGYCVLVTTNETGGSGLYAVISPLGDAVWGEAVPLRLSNRAALKKALVSDGESYAVAWEDYDDSDQVIAQYTASVYQGTGWDTLADPISIVPVGSFITGPAIEIAGLNGHYVLATKQRIDGTDSITATQYDSNGGWGETLTLEGDSGSAKDPSIAVIPDSGLAVIWHQINDTGTDISTYCNRWDGSQWRGKRLLSEASYLLGSSHTPQIVAADNGKTLAVWSQDRNGYRALIASLQEGDSWAPPVVLSDSITTVDPQIASNGTGFAMLWEEWNNNDYLLKGLALDGNDLSESVVQDIALLHQSSKPIPMALASNGSGYMSLYVLYNPSSDIYGNLTARHFDGTVWRDSVTIAEDVYFESGHPRVATNGTTYRTAWLTWGETIDLYSSQYDGEAWSSDQLVAADLEIISISDYWEGSPGAPQLASNGEGYGIFWFDRGNVMSSLYANGGWSTPEDIGDIEFFSWNHNESPRVASNGAGYAVAWRSITEQIFSTLYANVYDGTAWGGIERFNASQSVIFDMIDNNRLLKASGEKYALLWGTPYSEILTSVYDGTQWSAITKLNDAQNSPPQFQLASDGAGFLAAWIQDSGNSTYELVMSGFKDNEWGSPEIVDRNEFSKYDLNLQGGADSYQAIWTRAEQGGDPQVRIPWAVSGF